MPDAVLREVIEHVPETPQRGRWFAPIPTRTLRTLSGTGVTVLAAAIVLLFGGVLLVSLFATQSGDGLPAAAVTTSPDPSPTQEATGPEPVTSPKEDEMKLTTPIATALAVGMLATPGSGVSAQSDETEAAEAPALVTEVVAPGVEHVLGDDVGHDLMERYPSNRLDLDQMAVGPDGTVWLRTSASGSDNDSHAGVILFALGLPGTYTVPDGLPWDADGDIVIAPDGTPFLYGEEIFSFDGEQWASDPGSRRIDGPDSSFYLIEPEDLPAVTGDAAGGTGADGTGVLAISWSDHWTNHAEQGDFVFIPTASRPWVGDSIWIDGENGIVWRDQFDRVTRYLEGTWINHIALAPDGSLWAAGGFDGGGGGLYRITPE